MEIPSNRPLLTIIAVLALLALGMTTGSIGPAIPSLAVSWEAPLDQTGAMFTLLFIGNALGTAVGGLLLDRIGRKPVIVAGMVMLCIGVAMIALAPSLEIGLAGALIDGIGSGLFVGVNVFIGELYPDRRSQALNLASAAFGIGSLISPVAIGLVVEASGSPVPVLAVLSAAALAVGLAFFLVRMPRTVRGSGNSSGGFKVVLRDSYIILLSIMLFLYVGSETAFGGWAYSFAQSAGLDDAVSGLAATVFWAAITVGRMAAGFLGRWFDSTRLALLGAGLATSSAALLVVGAGSGPMVFLCSVLMGLGLAPIFPTSIGLAADRHPQAPGIAVSIVSLISALGGSLLPYVVGFLMVGYGVPAAAGAISLAVLCVVALLFLMLVTGSRRATASATQ